MSLWELLVSLFVNKNLKWQVSNDNPSSYWFTLLWFNFYPESCVLVSGLADLNVPVIYFTVLYFKYLLHVQQCSLDPRRHMHTHMFISLHQTQPAAFTLVTQQAWFPGYRADKSFTSELSLCLLTSASGWLIKFKAPVPSLSIQDHITQNCSHCV